MHGYTDWAAFRFQGRRFLACEEGHKVHVFGEKWAKYGSYYDIDSFKRMYRQQGEELRLN